MSQDKDTSPLPILFLTIYAVANAVGTLVGFVFVPQKYFRYYPWALVLIVLIGAVITVVTIHRRLKASHATREAELLRKIAELSRHPYDDAVRLEVEKFLNPFTPRHMEIARKLLIHGPISLHDIASQMQCQSGDAMRNEIRALMGSANIIKFKVDDGRTDVYYIAEKFQPAMKDYLFPRANSAGA